MDLNQGDKQVVDINASGINQPSFRRFELGASVANLLDKWWCEGS